MILLFLAQIVAVIVGYQKWVRRFLCVLFFENLLMQLALEEINLFKQRRTK